MNNLLNPASGVLTMSSREIAELCDKQHNNVMRDIRAMLVELHGEGGVLRFEHTYRNEQNGQEYPIFNLPKRETLILISGYRLDLRARIIDRWQELEAKAAAEPVKIPDLSDPVVLTQLLIEHASKRIEAEQRAATAEAAVEAAKPKTDFVDRFVKAEGLYGLQNAARVLNQPPNKFIGWLKQRHLFYQGGSLIPHVQYREQGIFEVKATIIEDKARYQTYITPKGLRYFADKLREQEDLLSGLMPARRNGAAGTH